MRELKRLRIAIERMESRRKKLIGRVMSGVPPAAVKDEMTADAARREELKATCAAVDGPGRR